MAINESGKWFYLTRDGEVYEGDEPPSGSTVLAAPGGNVPDDVIARHGLKPKFAGPDTPPDAADGEPLVRLESGRAVAASALHPDDPRRKDAESARGKHVAGPAETKHQPAPKAKAVGEADDPKPKGK